MLLAYFLSNIASYQYTSKKVKLIISIPSLTMCYQFNPIAHFWGGSLSVQQ